MADDSCLEKNLTDAEGRARGDWAEDEDGGKDAMLFAEPEIAVERARFVGSFPYEAPRGKVGPDGKTKNYGDRENSLEDRALLYMLVGARHVRESDTVQDWREYTSQYPDAPLTPDDADRRGNAHAVVRCHYTYEAVTRLLDLIGAPAAMKSDFELFLRRQRPRAAEGRARAQEQILKTPDASLRQIAKSARYDPGELSRDLKKRYLLWPGRVLGRD